MKLKFNYFAQQFLSHFLVVLVALLTLTFLFGHFIERFVYDNQTEELISYGQAILNDVETTNRNISPVLTAYRHVLNSQDIQYSLFDERSAITYSTNLRAASIELNEQEWQHLRNGRAITVKQEYERFGQAVTYVLLPHFQQQHFVGGILLTSPIQESKQVIAQMNEYVFITLLITLMIALLISGFLSKILGNRIKKLRTATATVAQGNYTVRLPIKQRDELGELAQDFNTMVKQLQQSHEEIEALEKRRRQFIADVSHELRTPLTTIRGVIEGLMTHLISEKEKQRGLELASKETRRLLRLVNENLDYEKIRSNQVHLVKQPIQLIELFSIIKEQLQVNYH